MNNLKLLIFTILSFFSFSNSRAQSNEDFFTVHEREILDLGLTIQRTQNKYWGLSGEFISLTSPKGEPIATYVKFPSKLIDSTYSTKHSHNSYQYEFASEGGILKGFKHNGYSYVVQYDMHCSCFFVKGQDTKSKLENYCYFYIHRLLAFFAKARPAKLYH